MATENLNSTIVYLLPGMKIEITEQEQFFPELGTVYHRQDGQVQPINLTETNGFVLDDTTVGTLEPVTDGRNAVTYTHRKSAPNAIWFYARTGEKAVCNVTHVPIHDHSSIVQGGPAFGTYFNDDMVLSDEDTDA